MSTIPNDPEFNGPVSKAISRFGMRLVKFLIRVGIVLLIIALLLPAYRSVRPAARRSWCVNNMKQIALAIDNYEQAYNVLPPAYTVDAQGRPLHSWRTLILPYLEQKTLYETIDLSKPWDAPANATALASKLSVFLCPDSVNGNRTSYLANVGPDGYLAPDRPRQLKEITDGLSNTLALIEVDDDTRSPGWPRLTPAPPW